MAHYDAQFLFDGFEENDYVEMADFIDQVEAVQAEAVGQWLIEHLKPSSVIDLGGNSGIYLKPYENANCKVLCVDAIPYPPGGRHLKNPKKDYLRYDLRFPFIAPFRADLAICLETCEHIEQHYHPRLIDSLWDTSDTILFSCAVPGQGGTHHKGERHTNEIIELFRERHGYIIHPLQDEFKAFLQTFEPLRKTGEFFGWLIDHAILFHTDQVWSPPTSLDESWTFLGGLSYNQWLAKNYTKQRKVKNAQS